MNSTGQAPPRPLPPPVPEAPIPPPAGNEEYVTETHTCKHCRRIVVHDEDLEASQALLYNDSGRPNRARMVRLPHTRRDIQRARQDACPFFTLWYAPERNKGKRITNWDLVLALVGKGSISSSVCRAKSWTSKGRHYLHFIRQLSQFVWCAGLFLTIDEFNHLRLGTGSGEFLVVLKYEQPGSRLMTTMRYPPDVASQGAFERLQREIDFCRSAHSECSNPPSSLSRVPPARLVFLGTSDAATQSGDVMLLETREIQGEYEWCALSYCWGGPQPVQTTTATITSHKRGIPIRSLPKSLRDGIQVCSRVGIPYIWIDCLCIVQDSVEDKQSELPKMASIYRDAFLVISAASAATVSDGFLQHRKVFFRRGPPIWIGYQSASTGGQATEFTLTDLQGIPTSVLDDRDPIDKRGWAFQEIALSTRAVVYGTYELKFSCRENQKAESGHVSSSGVPQWGKAVRWYSGRQITYPHDKLAAISALADLYQRNKGYNYLAGLWREELPMNLLWSSGAGSTTGQNKGRCSIYRAPSWSWAALDHEVHPNYSGHSSRSSPSTYVTEADVLDVEVITNPPHVPFGIVTSASITLRAPMMKGTWQRNNTTSSKITYGSPARQLNANDYTMDVGNHELPLSQPHVYLFPIVSFATGGLTCVQGLILTRVPGRDDTFQRIGWLELLFDDWTEEKQQWKTETIVIV